MGKVRTLFVMTLALAAAGVSRAATLVDVDFTKGDTKGFVLNGDQVAIVDAAGDATRPKALALTTNDLSQLGYIWSDLKQQVPSFSYIAEVRVQFNPDGFEACPADGFTMAYADAATDEAGPAGGQLGLLSSGIPQLAAVEVNTWRNQGLGTDADQDNCTTDKNVTFAFDVLKTDTPDESRVRTERQTQIGDVTNGGVKLAQTLPPAGAKIVNGGWYRYQFNANSDGTLDFYLTGLEESNKAIQKVKVTTIKMGFNPINFAGRWGFTASTGGAVETVELARIRVESPMVDPQ
jgi:hypothetical protein